MAKLFTVFVKAPKGHSGSIPIKVSGSRTVNGVEDRFITSVNIPFDKTVEDVPEEVVEVLKKQFSDIKVEEQKEKKAEKKKPEAPAQ